MSRNKEIVFFKDIRSERNSIVTYKKKVLSKIASISFNVKKESLTFFQRSFETDPKSARLEKVLSHTKK